MQGGTPAREKGQPPKRVRRQSIPNQKNEGESGTAPEEKREERSTPRRKGKQHDPNGGRHPTGCGSQYHSGQNYHITQLLLFQN